MIEYYVANRCSYKRSLVGTHLEQMNCVDGPLSGERNQLATSCTVLSWARPNVVLNPAPATRMREYREPPRCEFDRYHMRCVLTTRRKDAVFYTHSVPLVE